MSEVNEQLLAEERLSSPPRGVVGRSWDFLVEHKVSICLGLVIIAVIILIIIGYTTTERFGDVFYLDQMAMLNTDPTNFKHTGNERDVLGESGRDYYLMNQMYANNRAAPQLLEDNKAYTNRTNYLDMPHQYRPHPLPAVLENRPIEGRFVRPIFAVGNSVSREHGPESDI